jgi:hypothetical protein
MKKVFFNFYQKYDENMILHIIYVSSFLVIY